MNSSSPKAKEESDPLKNRKEFLHDLRDVDTLRAFATEDKKEVISRIAAIFASEVFKKLMTGGSLALKSSAKIDWEDDCFKWLCVDKERVKKNQELIKEVLEDLFWEVGCTFNKISFLNDDNPDMLEWELEPPRLLDSNEDETK